MKKKIIVMKKVQLWLKSKLRKLGIGEKFRKFNIPFRIGIVLQIFRKIVICLKFTMQMQIVQQ